MLDHLALAIGVGSLLDSFPSIGFMEFLLTPQVMVLSLTLEASMIILYENIISCTYVLPCCRAFAKNKINKH